MRTRKVAMGTGLNISNSVVQDAANLLDDFEVTNSTEENNLETTTVTASSPQTQQTSANLKNNPLMAKLVLERENRKKSLNELAFASQQMQFMEWLGTADEDDTELLVMDHQLEGVSFYEKVHLMMEEWVKDNWLLSKDGTSIAMQACLLNTDLPMFSIEDLKNKK
ncbi:MAG: hypothetical protein AB8E15_10140 [Bdellovibrionales bacterium]